MKKRKQITCPHEVEFAEDWNDIPDCKTCRIADKCKAAHNAKSKTKPKEKRKQDNRGIYIPRPALNKLLNVTYHTCVRHYLFYMKEAARQKTNRPWCNSPFTAKGLGCCVGTVETCKTALVEAGFIKKIPTRKDGKKYKTYIELQYLPTKFVIENQEYKRRLEKLKKEMDEIVEEGAYWINALTKEKSRYEVLEVKYRNLRCENKELKRKNK